MEEKKLLRFLILFYIFNISLLKAENFIDNTDYTNINNIINQYNNIKTNNLVLNKNSSEITYIFISFSMPSTMIINYFLESQGLEKKEQIIFVLRGFYKNSFKETTKKIKQLTENNNDKALGIIVDPMLFREYNIQNVPTFVKKYKDGSYDKISGSITLNYVLNKFLEKEK